MDWQACQDHKEDEETLEKMGQLEYKEPVGPLVQQDQKENKEYRALEDFK